MIRSFIRYLKGYVGVRIRGDSPERFVNLCTFHKIDVRKIVPREDSYDMYISISDFKKLRPVVKKTHMRVVLFDRRGFPFFLAKNKRRKAFFLGAFLFAVLLNVYSLFIWDIHFEGNSARTDETLSLFLAEQGILPGVLKKSVDCPGIVKEIRKEYNDIIWVSASIEGCRLNIRVKENTDTFLQETQNLSEEKIATDLIALKDGVITKIITRSGIPLVHVGDSVKKGDILVSGREEILNDGGEVTGYQYHHSDADIFADTSEEYTDILPLNYTVNNYTGRVKKQFYVRTGNWTVAAGSVKNEYEYSEEYTYERQLRAGENFVLPFTFGIRTVRAYHPVEKKYDKDELQQILSSNFKEYCRELKEKGIQILENNVKIQLNGDSASASGILLLNEAIAGKADTEIITIERKETDESVGTDD